MRGLLHVQFILFLITISLPRYGSITPAKTADLAPIRRMFRIADDLTIFARLVNGIALGQSLANGSVQVSSIVGELLHLGPNITLDTLITDGLSGLHAEIEAITNVVRYECREQGGCGHVASISDGLKVLERFGEFVGGMMKVMSIDSPLGLTVAFEHSLRNVTNAGEMAISLGDTKKDIIFKETWQLRNLTDRMDDLLRDLRIINVAVKKLKQKDIIHDISVMLRIVNVTKNFTADQEGVDKMRMVLEETKKNIGALRSVISKKTVKSINGKLGSLGRLMKNQHSLAARKLETSGLYGGIDDLNEFSDDLQTEFVTEIVGNGQNIEDLGALLRPVIELGEQLEPLRESWKYLKLEQKTDDVELMQKHLEAVAQEVDSQFASVIASVPSVRDCFETVWLDENLNITLWRIAMSQMTIFDRFKTDYLNNVKDKKNPFKLIDTVFTYIEMVKNGSDADKFAKYKSVAISRQLTDMGNAISEMQNRPTIAYLKKSFIATVPATAAVWMNKSGISRALKCLEDNKGLTSSGFANASLASLHKFNSNADKWREIQMASYALREPLEKWKIFKSSKNGSRTTRSAVNQLRDARQLSQELSAGVKVVRGLVEIYKKRKVIEKLIGEQKSIDKDIKGLKDPKQKKEAESVWTVETKTALKSLVEKIGQLAQTIDKSPEKITDFAIVFEKVKTFDFPKIDTQKLKAGLSFLKKPPGIQDTLRDIGDLDLKFANAKQQLQTASNTLQKLMTYFDGYLNVVRLVPTTTIMTTTTIKTIVDSDHPEASAEHHDIEPPPQSPIASAFHEPPANPESSGYWSIISLVLGIILVISIGANLYLVCDNIRKKKEIADKKSLKESNKELPTATTERNDRGDTETTREDKKSSTKENDICTLPTVKPSKIGSALRV